MALIKNASGCFYHIVGASALVDILFNSEGRATCLPTRCPPNRSDNASQTDPLRPALHASRTERERQRGTVCQLGRSPQPAMRTSREWERQCVADEVRPPASPCTAHRAGTASAGEAKAPVWRAIDTPQSRPHRHIARTPNQVTSSARRSKGKPPAAPARQTRPGPPCPWHHRAAAKGPHCRHA